MSKAIGTRSPNLLAPLGPKAPGDVAAGAFALFDRGVPPDEVVTELMLPVDTAESLWRTWAPASRRCASIGGSRASTP